MPQIETAQDGEWFPSADPSDRLDNGAVAVMGRFIWAKILDIPKSKAEDKEIYKKVPAVEHKARGSADVSVNKINADNSQYWVNRFPDAWLAFQGKDVALDGTPLNTKDEMGDYVLDDMNADRVKILRLQGVRTIEELAELVDAECERMGFGYKTLRKQAQEYLKPEKRGPGRPKKDINKELDAINAKRAEVA
jgi:hypothetical protein